ncbi:MAG: trypsin-like peptidase domain-containing protein [Anaerolineales bacterium]|nr:trypsin-like peptidase domain-containing protein [Anaerolineales bacterium]MCW5838474.1 trypsin-like peptidase domain-containing protein [Anaerolineales bacterium]
MQAKRTRSFVAVISVLVLAALACGTIRLPDASQALQNFSEQVQEQVENMQLPQIQSNPQIQVSSDMLSQQEALVSLYEAVSPGVVSIAVATQQGSGQGSGFVYDVQGHIVTNFHVVENAQYIEVTFPSGFQAIGKVIGEDRDSDLAVLKIEAPASELTPLVIGDSDTLHVGQYVVAIGNPFGLSGSMSLGVISSKGRSLESLNFAPDSNQYFSAGDILQTDAAINPGNSGGPLLNLYGEVIGVNRAIRSFSFNDSGDALNSGVGFAISSNIVKRVVPSLIATGHYEYPYLGLSSTSNLSLAAARELGLEDTNGALVANVVAGGPSDKAGLRQGDMIVAIDGRHVKNFDELISYLFSHASPGDVVQLDVLREGQPQQIELTLGARPVSP